MRFKLQAGREIDVLTKSELKEGLTETTASWYQEAARGISTARFDSTAAIAAASLALPGPGERNMGPDVGFVWRLVRVTADGLAAADVLTVYRNSATPANRLGQLTAAANFTTRVILRGDERLLFTGATLTATGDITVSGEAIEVAESDFYKLV